MSNILPDIETLESVTKVLAEQVKAVYFYFNKDKDSLYIDESNDEYISFSFKDPKNFILDNRDNFPDIEKFISYLGALGAKFDIFNVIDDNKNFSINFNVKRLPL